MILLFSKAVSLMSRDESYCSVKGCSQPPWQPLWVITAQSFTQSVATNSALGTTHKMEMVLGRPIFALKSAFWSQEIRAGPSSEWMLLSGGFTWGSWRPRPVWLQKALLKPLGRTMAKGRKPVTWKQSVCVCVCVTYRFSKEQLGKPQWRQNK